MVSICIHGKTEEVVLFVGGGAIAARRLQLFVNEPCRLLVISPVIDPTITELVKTGRVEWRNACFNETDIEGLPQCRFVFACTDNKPVNELVAQVGRSHHKLVNRCDDSKDCDFSLPSTLQLGNLEFSISANGISPRVNKLIRQDMTNRYSILQIALPSLKIMREDVKLLLSEPNERQKFWRTHLTIESLEAILSGEWQRIEGELHHAISGLRIKS